VRQAATGISKIDELVNTFIDAEDQNFSLFNYVNELNNEVPSTHPRTPAVPNDAVGMMNAARRCRILHAHPVMRGVPSRSAAAGGLAPPRAT
jgi:hypothetical protein